MKSFSKRLSEVEARGAEAADLVAEFQALHPLGTTIESGSRRYKIGIPMLGGVVFYVEDLEDEESASFFAPSIVFDFTNFIIHTERIKSEKIIESLVKDEDFNLLFKISEIHDDTFILECQINLMGRWMINIMEKILNNMGEIYGFKVGGITS